MLDTELFYLTLLHSFIGYFFEYLPAYPLQVCGFYLTIFKDLTAFLPCSFTTSTVKGIDNFWKLRGIIGGFKDPYRQIASGVVKPADESMHAIRFHATLKGYLPH